ncbi:hypothetical protein M0R88_14605 [Halorussus gelatinilyticus]|uniref:DUF7552 domain-containing protein n=1 Tax=Halorussus gelatinilyticus TaxID=2937524 RepID=A0A8U0IFS7_9EURY|nr:hypothetical protein [Halorussus gelatinilyticus]UPV99737.1 hypothetical protein M0R88_14605 [Halorussus gelatinilyticus]
MSDSLDTIRREIDDIAAEDGDFYVACADTDERPAPLTGRRFPTEEAANEAADLARSYRATLRESDPDLPEHRLSVYECTDDPPTMVSTRERAAGTRENGLPRTSRSVTLSGDCESEWLRMDNAPLVHVRRDGEPLPDDAVERQLDSKL